MASQAIYRGGSPFLSVPPVTNKIIWTDFVNSAGFHALDPNLQRSILRTGNAIGCVLTEDGQYNGSALLIGRGLILVPKHCFPYEEGKIQFSAHRSPISAKTLIDGERDPRSAFRADYKILQTQEAYDLEPARLSVDTPYGNFLQLRYQVDGVFYVTFASSVDYGGGYATRSDLSSVITTNGDSGGARFSFTVQAVHSMHQGESEALKINDIYHSLQTIRGAESIIAELENNIIDLQYAGMAFSTVALQSGQVIPERHGTLVATLVSAEKIYPIKEVVFNDIVGYLDGLNHAAVKINFYNNLWRTGYRVELPTYTSEGTRLDCQSPSKTARNIQFQTKGITLATVVVSNKLAGRKDPAAISEVANYVIRKFRNAIVWAKNCNEARVIAVAPLTDR